MRRLLVLFFIFIFFEACNSGKTPDGIIPQEAMIDVLTDMHLADGYTSSLIDTPQIVAVYQSLYKTHGIDSLKFMKSLSFYSKDPVRLKEMYGQVESRLSVMEKDEQKKEEIKRKQQEKRDKQIADSLKRQEKLRKDSLRRDSIKMISIKKEALRKDSLKKDSVKKAKMELKLKKERKKNDLPAKRNR
ncbi:DUF4296 domain-containing protein [Desertivirga xinjiangensis]|uniref:DUF4296 domain-containing protein n=1 Tax=Desertivirga xinjiangensis TaxID=539206 RepID=UPI00210D9E75|nr:DUF4296 domain-containing protein [Pedobacter xinjiangensis]